MAHTVISAKYPPLIDPTRATIAYGDRALPRLVTFFLVLFMRFFYQKKKMTYKLEFFSGFIYTHIKKKTSRFQWQKKFYY